MKDLGSYLKSVCSVEDMRDDLRLVARVLMQENINDTSRYDAIYALRDVSAFLDKMEDVENNC